MNATQLGRNLVFASALFAALPAFAASTVIGGGNARGCYEAAEFNQSVKVGLAVCNAAINEDAMAMGQRASTYVNRGIVHMHARNLTAAIADYDAALRLNANLAEAHVNKGIALVHLGGRDQDAVNSLTKGLEENPSRPEIAYYTRAIAYELIGKTREAYEDYKAAVALKPDWAEASEQLQRYSVVRKPTASS
jgi:tetratricopeptide (TPR) repeat protein